MAVLQKILPYLLLLLACIALLNWPIADTWWQQSQSWVYQALIGFILAINLLLRRLKPLLTLALLCLYFFYVPSTSLPGLSAIFICLALIIAMPERGFLQASNLLWLGLICLPGLVFYFQQPLMDLAIQQLSQPINAQWVDYSLYTILLICSGLAGRRLHQDGSTVSAGLLTLMAWCLLNQYWQHDYPLLEPALALCLMLSLLDYRHLAYLDDLTGLPSRRACNEALARVGRNSYLVMLDVDHFKKVNDSHGHDVGDQVLKMLAGQLQKLKHGSAFRFGGEEFCLIYAKAPNTEIEQRLDRLREQIADYQLQLREHRLGKESRKVAKQKKTGLSITVSMGVACFDQAQDDFEKVLKRADDALYKAKKQGRNRVVFDSGIKR